MILLIDKSTESINYDLDDTLISKRLNDWKHKNLRHLNLYIM